MTNRALTGNYQVLNRLFTQKCINALLCGKDRQTYRTAVERYVAQPMYKTNFEVFNGIYDYMAREYRNEYYYQNTLFNNLLLAKHGERTMTALRQVLVGRSRADFILINGFAVVYEIKTELDNYERLLSQLNEYYRAFSKVSVVVPEEKFKEVGLALKDYPAGIRVLTKDNTIAKNVYVEAKEETSHLEHEVLFRMLRKNEYEHVIRQQYGQLPDTTQAFYYDACYELFCGIPVKNAGQLVIQELKRRRLRSSAEMRWIRELPNGLRSLYYFTDDSSIDRCRLEIFLKEQYTG